MRNGVIGSRGVRGGKGIRARTHTHTHTPDHGGGDAHRDLPGQRSPVQQGDRGGSPTLHQLHGEGEERQVPLLPPDGRGGSKGK